MKKIIKNKRYDTETAREIGYDRYNGSTSDFAYWCETLYCKRTGEYFIYGEGGPASKYAETAGQNEWCGGERIIPMNYENAREWAERHLDADDYEKEFGEVAEDDSTETVTISLPASTIAKIRRKAQEAGTSVSGIIGEMLAGLE